MMFLENREIVGYRTIAFNSPLQSQKSFLKRLLAGELGLVKTFWIYVCMVGIFINIGILMTDVLTIKLLIIPATLVLLAYAAPLQLAVWRAANKYRGPKIWATLAKLNVQVNLFAFAWMIVLSVMFVNVDSYLSHM